MAFIEPMHCNKHNIVYLQFEIIDNQTWMKNFAEMSHSLTIQFGGQDKYSYQDQHMKC